MLWKMLLAAARRGRDRIVFQEGASAISFEELVSRASTVARLLAARGVEPGDIVGSMARGGIRGLTCIYGALGASATVVPLNPALREREVRAALAPCRPRLIVCEEDHGSVLAGVDAEKLTVDEALRGAPGSLRERRAAPDRVAFLLFSTGSTGKPKRLARTHAMMAAEADQYQAAVRLGPEDRILGVTPVYHSYALCCVALSAIRSGARARLVGEFQPDIILEQATRERATVLAGTPFHYSILAGMRPRPGVDLRSLRWALSCGAAAPEPVLEKFRSRYGVPIRQLYGASEVGSVSLNVSNDPVPNAASAGTPLPGVLVRIMDDQGRQAPAGETGEVAVRSAASSLCYEDMPELSRATFRDGWFHSGDLGRVDPEGNLRITGRVKLLINVGGNKVDPLEVESVLADHPAVGEAAVVGAEASHGLEAVKAVVVLRQPAEAEALRAFCAERLIGYKVPRVIEFREALPRSATGKLLRKDLVEDAV